METLSNQNNLLVVGARLELEGWDVNRNKTGAGWVTVENIEINGNDDTIVKAKVSMGPESIFIINHFDADGNAVNVTEVSGVDEKRQFVGRVPLMTIRPWVPKNKSRNSLHT